MAGHLAAVVAKVRPLVRRFLPVDAMPRTTPNHAAYLVPGRWGHDWCCAAHEAAFERSARRSHLTLGNEHLTGQQRRYIEDRLGAGPR
jgi:hypothetical protein